jgi:hypothetical protein
MNGKGRIDMVYPEIDNWDSEQQKKFGTGWIRFHCDSRSLDDGRSGLLYFSLFPPSLGLCISCSLFADTDASPFICYLLACRPCLPFQVWQSTVGAWTQASQNRRLCVPTCRAL